MEENRKYKRVTFREPIRYSDSPFNVGAGSLSCDLSEGGLRCYSEEFIPLNSEMTMELKLENSQKVQLKGQVVWVQRVPHAERYQVGIKFNESERNLLPRRQIQSYLE